MAASLCDESVQFYRRSAKHAPSMWARTVPAAARTRKRKRPQRTHSLRPGSVQAPLVQSQALADPVPELLGS